MRKNSNNTSTVQNKRKRTIMNILIILCILVFLVCLYKLGSYYIGTLKYRKNMKKLATSIGGGIAKDKVLIDYVPGENHDPLIFPDETKHELVEYISIYSKEISNAWKEKYEYLSSINHDCFGYIEIPNTILSYPVMFVPSDYQYYLSRNFEKKYEMRGLPFMDVSTKIGLSKNYLVYGHNMQDETSFGLLRSYLKQSFYEEHPFVYFNTSISEGIYQIMYVCRSKVFEMNEDCFKYYQYGGLMTEREFNTYLSEMQKIALYETGISAEWGDELLTLSTCDHYVDDGRLVIVCKRVQ